MVVGCSRDALQVGASSHAGCCCLAGARCYWLLHVRRLLLVGVIFLPELILTISSTEVRGEESSGDADSRFVDQRY